MAKVCGTLRKGFRVCYFLAKDVLKINIEKALAKQNTATHIEKQMQRQFRNKDRNSLAKSRLKSLLKTVAKSISKSILEKAKAPSIQ